MIKLLLTGDDVTVMSDLTQRLQACYASAVHDVLRQMGHDNCVLPSNLIALDPTQRLAGEIYTISGHIDRTLSPHQSLLAWAQVLSLSLIHISEPTRPY